MIDYGDSSARREMADIRKGIREGEKRMKQYNNRGGGSAFPFSHVLTNDNDEFDNEYTSEGMSVRDYMATHLAVGFVMRSFSNPFGIEEEGYSAKIRLKIAETSFLMADDLLAVRLKGAAQMPSAQKAIDEAVRIFNHRLNEKGVVVLADELADFRRTLEQCYGT